MSLFSWMTEDESILVESSFDELTREKARVLFPQRVLSFSFRKGSIERHLVLSGIVVDENRSLESRVTVKKEESGGYKTSTKCNCLYSASGIDCQHALLLLLAFFYEHHQD